MRRAALLADVSVVFVAEVADRRKHGVRSRLPKTAQRAILDSEAKLLEKFNKAIDAAFEKKEKEIMTV